MYGQLLTPCKIWKAPKVPLLSCLGENGPLVGAPSPGWPPQVAIPAAGGI